MRKLNTVKAGLVVGVVLVFSLLAAPGWQRSVDFLRCRGNMFCFNQMRYERERDEVNRIIEDLKGAREIPWNRPKL